MNPMAPPDFTWYSSESVRLGLKTPRCPFATVHDCPRYYASVSLLGGYGCTAIEPEEDERLKNLWVQSPLWPKVSEDEPGIGATEKGPLHYMNFCPEVTGNRFGHFARYLAHFIDEIDEDNANQRLECEGASADDPRRRWQSIVPQHYSECPLYSQLAHRSTSIGGTEAGIALAVAPKLDSVMLAQLVSDGESAIVDFKIRCDAFNKGEPNAEKAKAELVKDICAMANNQEAVSHLIIGVSDNGRDFCSVSNSYFTDDNLQSLCKDAISPPPKLRSKYVKVPPGYGNHTGKECLIIQIGPHPPTAFHLNRDFISHDDVDSKYRFNFKKHETWIRRGATSGLAAPTEIIALSMPGIGGPPPLPGSIDDPKLRSLVLRIRRIFAEHGLEPGHIARFLKVRKAPFGIDLRDSQTDPSLLRWLNESKIDWIAKTFLIRREWIDGEDEAVHEKFSFDKRPELFFSTISQHVEGLVGEEMQDCPTAYFIRHGVGKEWSQKGNHSLFVVVAVPLARLSNERTIFKYITDFQAYSWEYRRTNIQLRAWARLLSINMNIHCFGQEIEYEAGHNLASNSGFLRDVIDNRLKHPSDDWHPEDYALYPEESQVAKRTKSLKDVLSFLRKHDLPWEITRLGGSSVKA